jgi:hypothetical protein
MRKQGSAIGQVRRGLYKTARLLGDLHAVTTGKIGRRLVNRAIGRAIGRLFWK